MYITSYSGVPNKQTCALTDFGNYFKLYTLIQALIDFPESLKILHGIIAKLKTNLSIINIKDFYHPVRLVGPVRLFGALEYVLNLETLIKVSTEAWFQIKIFKLNNGHAVLQAA